jgi:hypothetical protein
VHQRVLVAAILAAVFAVVCITPAAADVRIRVDKSSQTMTVAVDGWVQHQWPVSTAKSGYYTPTGTWRPTRLEPSWYSRKYDNAPMPFTAPRMSDSWGGRPRGVVFVCIRPTRANYSLLCVLTA